MMSGIHDNSENDNIVENENVYTKNLKKDLTLDEKLVIFLK